MKKISMILLIGVVSSTLSAQTNDDVLHELFQLSKRYEVGMNAGYGLSIIGTIIAPIGAILMIVGNSFHQSEAYSSQAIMVKNINTSGYSLMGVGITSLIIGIITWRDQEKRYIDITNRAYKYREFLQKKENNYE